MACIRGSSGEQLDRWARAHRIAGWLGVFASDTLPDLVLEVDRAGLSRAPPATGFCLISNMSPARDGGTHWTAFSHLRAPNQPSRYFDSYGAPPDGDDAILHVSTDYRDYLRRNSSTGSFVYNKFDLQASKDFLNPDTCGEWALYFLSTGGVIPEQKRDPATGRVASRGLSEPWSRVRIAAVNNRSVSSGMLRAWAANPRDEKAGMANDLLVRKIIGILPTNTPAC